MRARNYPLLLLLPAASLCAQDYRVEVFGGYVNQRGDGTAKRDGWIASETVYIRPWIGVTAEFAGLYNSQEAQFPDGASAISNLDDDRQSYLFGPRVRLFSKGAFTLGGHGLLGVGRRDNSYIVFEDDRSRYFEFSDHDLAGAAGVTLDFRLSDRLSWRLQPDWFFFGSPERSNSVRLGTGLVFRFGR